MAEKSIRLSPVFSLEEEMDGYTPLRLAIGAQGELCVLLTEHVPAYIDGMFPPTITEESRTYRGIVIRDGCKHVYDFPEEKWNYHFFEPIDHGENLLLCSARAYHHGDGKIEQNARVYSTDGQLLREFCLGDGIEHLSVTPDNHIWCGYFDEGVSGNFGWNDPLGRSGLVKWKADGRIAWEYKETGNRVIDDCYAMTVTGNEAAFHYYTDFDVGFTQSGETAFYITDIDGAYALAVTNDGSRILFQEDNRFFCTERKGSRYVRRGLLQFRKPNGKKLSPLLVATRGPLLLMMDGPDLYLYDISGH
ncbi:hypothetical protein AV656_11080 [Bhargavaea cecembensis]|uniref:Uncharacterized protein n=2 Tax=Bhargavaea cecembensis TaxID=394098 RepID=A0A161RGL8_9BACL|nr:hypothetical protein AV656_11080 [Bhargavaea cecembensis]